MDIQAISESLKTESIINYLLTVDFIKLLKNPIIIVPSFIAFLAMLYLKMVKTITTIICVVILWIVAVKFSPGGGIDIALNEMGIFIFFCVLIAAALIYVFLIKGD
jgi:uncharacterized membrane protein YecN with MAPEG domain